MEIEVRVDRDALAGHGMTIFDVITGLARQNVAAPGGIVYGAEQEYLLKVSGEFSGLRSVEEMPLRMGSGEQILLRDVAEGRSLGDTTTLADASVFESIRTGAGSAEEG